MTLHESYAALAGEPWCYSPDIIARLTDYQIRHLYLLPAARRAEEMERRQKGDATPVVAPGEAPNRAQMVSLLMTFQGMSQEQANREFDRQLAAWRKQQGK